MIFNLSEWLRDNLIQTYKERSFTVAQINLMSFNYFNKGQLTEDDFNIVINAIDENTEENNDEIIEEDEDLEDEENQTDPEG